MITWQTPLVKTQHDASIPVRQAMKAIALRMVGIEAGRTETRSLFEDILGPPRGGWNIGKPYGKGGPSTCSMVAMYAVRCLAVDDKAVMGPYKVATGIGVLRTYAQRLRPVAWVTPGKGKRPGIGDIIDTLAPRAVSNHSEIVIGWDGDIMRCVAGGQVGMSGLQAIHETRRLWVDGARPTSSGAVVQGWVDIEKLRYRGVFVVPEGWDSMTK